MEKKMHPLLVILLIALSTAGGIFLTLRATRNLRHLGKMVILATSEDGGYQNVFIRRWELLQELGMNHQMYTMVLWKLIDSASTTVNCKQAYRRVSQYGCSSTLTQTAENKWNAVWFREMLEIDPDDTPAIMAHCQLSHPGNPYLKDRLIRQIKLSGNNPDILFEIAHLAEKFSEVYLEAAGIAVAATIRPDDILSRLEWFKFSFEITGWMQERYVEIETRSDMLIDFVSRFGISTRIGKKAFEKVSAMPHPELETSGSYGAP